MTASLLRLKWQSANMMGYEYGKKPIPNKRPENHQHCMV
jgi:hypothetical protein